MARMIVLKNVTKKFGPVTVLSQVSLQIDPGEFLCVIGPSGAGKSTLIQLLVGAEDCTSGSIEVDGADLRMLPSPAMQMYRRRVGVVFQDYKLLQNRTVEENISFPLEVCGAPDAIIAKRVPELLKRMGLTSKANSLPRELSGGEKARVAIARAIVHTPRIVLADEPTGNLDPEQSRDILKLLQDVNHEGTTVLLATHDASLVDILHTRVVQLEAGKITRDNVGGYAGARRTSRVHAAPAARPSHHVVSDSAPTREEVPIAKKKGKSGGGRRKVHITSIHTQPE
jgi:cell division transport system ATP-binding protein